MSGSKVELDDDLRIQSLLQPEELQAMTFINFRHPRCPDALSRVHNHDITLQYGNL